MIVKLETKYKIDDVVECEDMFGHKCHGTVWGAYAEDDSVFYILKDVVHEKDKRIEKRMDCSSRYIKGKYENS